VRRIAAALANACLVAGAASAEPVDNVFRRVSAQHLLDTADVAAADLRLGLRAMTFDLLDLRLEVRTGHARLRLGGELTDSLELRVSGKVAWRDGGARVSSRLDLGLGGERFSLRIPDFTIAPCNVNGIAGVEVRVPVWEGRW
jgi:hypothetical protein